MNTNRPAQAHPVDVRPATPTTAPEERYSYLLRLWRSGADGAWRASLQSVQDGERHMFADVESLLTFLVEQVRSNS